MKKYFVAERREALGLTREQLAASSGLGESTIKKIENGQTTNPHPRNLDRLATALGTNRSGLSQPPSDAPASPRRQQRQVPSRAQLPPIESVWIDQPGLDEEERARRSLERRQLDRHWRAVLDMPGREAGSVYPPIVDRTPLRVRHEVVAAIASGGAPERVLTALLFAGLAWAVSYVSDALANDPAAYQAARIRLRLMLDEAMDFGELLWLADDFAGGAVGIQMERDTDAAQLRKYQRAVEAWEVTHAPVIQAWAQAGPTWDETGTRNMFAEVAPQFRAFAELFGQRMAAVLKQIGRDAGDA